MKIAVIRFPGSNCDLDMVHAYADVLKADCRLVWHTEFRDEFDAVALPGGWTYDDRLRSGLIAAFSPAMQIVKQMAREGKPVLGVCNGFQILIESGLLPGALLPNASLRFISKHVQLECKSERSLFSKGLKGKTLEIPIAHGEGRYFADEKTVKGLWQNEQVVFQYKEEVNGSVDRIAGICNLDGNVLGMMPHPERAAEKILGSEDGKQILANMLTKFR